MKLRMIYTVSVQRRKNLSIMISFAAVRVDGRQEITAVATVIMYTKRNMHAVVIATILIITKTGTGM